MHVVIVSNSKIPAIKYGGIERIIWWLGRELTGRGHKVTFVVLRGSSCPFAQVRVLDLAKPLHLQIPEDADFVHYLTVGDAATSQPYMVTIQGNTNNTQEVFDINSAFVSANHAARHGSTSYVHNGVDFDDYTKPNLQNKRKYVHFLANASWKVKNVKGAIRIAKEAGEKLLVLGGQRFNFNMGIRFTFDLHVRFMGQVDTAQKSKYMDESKALLFPVLWNEPFGIAIIESLYYGCPVLGTPYGSLPELVNAKVGYLSNSYEQLATALKNIDQFSRQDCYQYALDCFSISKMTDEYLMMYERVMNGEKLNAKPPQLIESVPKYLPMTD